MSTNWMIREDQLDTDQNDFVNNKVKNKGRSTHPFCIIALPLFYDPPNPGTTRFSSHRAFRTNPCT